MRDAAGITRAFAGLTGKDLPAVLLLDDKGGKRAGLALQAGGFPILSLDDEQGQGRIELSQRFDGPAHARIFDTAGQVAFEAP